MTSETDRKTSIETREQLAPLYKVLFHDDQKTTMDFVVDLGKKVFSLPEPRAIQVMIEVHTLGVSLVVVESFEQAEFHRDQCISLARGAGFPFCVTIEPQD
jgi:ATP-dependent Clp protease adaptor protein ClpS